MPGVGAGVNAISLRAPDHLLEAVLGGVGRLDHGFELVPHALQLIAQCLHRSEDLDDLCLADGRDVRTAASQGCAGLQWLWLSSNIVLRIAPAPEQKQLPG